MFSRNYIEQISKKLPFEQQYFQISKLSPVTKATLKGQKKAQQQLTTANAGPNDDGQAGNPNAQKFFNNLMTIQNIFVVPSMESILREFPHDNFESILYKFKVIPEDSEEDPENGEVDIDGTKEQRDEWTKQNQVGGKEWTKKQVSKIDQEQCPWIPNSNQSSLGKA